MVKGEAVRVQHWPWMRPHLYGQLAEHVEALRPDLIAAPGDAQSHPHAGRKVLRGRRAHQRLSCTHEEVSRCSVSLSLLPLSLFIACFMV
eukprot:scaffold367554_cov19-Prasinocladus_malaysianus.AAC.1